jgi:hypothetical protein
VLRYWPGKTCNLAKRYLPTAKRKTTSHNGTTLFKGESKNKVTRLASGDPVLH